jgi:hypothetical protein
LPALALRRRTCSRMGVGVRGAVVVLSDASVKGVVGGTADYGKGSGGWAISGVLDPFEGSCRVHVEVFS